MSDSGPGDVFDSNLSADANEAQIDDAVDAVDAPELVSPDPLIAGAEDGSEEPDATLDSGAATATAAVAGAAGAANALTRRATASTGDTRKVPPKSAGTPKRYTPPKTLAQRKAEEAMAKSGASRSEIAAASRAAARTGGSGAYVIPEQGQWVPYVMGACLVVGTLLIVVNYIAEISALGMPSPWYLAAGLFMLVLGFLTATKLR